MRNFSEGTFTDSVRNYLLNTHGVEYTGRFYYLQPTDFYDDGNQSNTYSLQWLENNIERPHVMMGDFNSEADFLAFVQKEIDSTRFWLKQVFTLKRTDEAGRT